MAEQNAHDDERDTADLAAGDTADLAIDDATIWLPLTRRALRRLLSS